MDCPLEVKENYKHGLDFALHLPHLSQSPALGGLLLCLRDITVKPAIVASDNPGQEGCNVRSGLTKLRADDNTLLFLISCRKTYLPRHTAPSKGI
jgi:hypothetical protein